MLLNDVFTFLKKSLDSKNFSVSKSQNYPKVGLHLPGCQPWDMKMMKICNILVSTLSTMIAFTFITLDSWGIIASIHTWHLANAPNEQCMNYTNLILLLQWICPKLTKSWFSHMTSVWSAIIWLAETQFI